jgi:hypothetical protein
LLGATACTLAYPTGDFEDGSTGGGAAPTATSSTGSGGAGAAAAACPSGDAAVLAVAQPSPTEVVLAGDRVLWVAGDGTIRAVDADRAGPANGDAADVFSTPTSPPQILRADGRVGWTRPSSETGCPDGTLVESVGLAGGEAAFGDQTCYDPIPALVIDQGIAFWTWSNGEGTRLSKTPFPGTTTTLLLDEGSISRLAVTADAVWFAHIDPVAQPTLYRVPRTFDAATVPEPIVPSGGQVFAMAADISHVYWTSELGVVRRCPRDGCGSDTVETVASNQPSAVDLALDDGAVYWVTTAAGGAVMCAPKDGGAAQVVAAVPGGAASVEVDAGGVYWADTMAGEVRALRR